MPVKNLRIASSCKITKLFLNKKIFYYLCPLMNKIYLYILYFIVVSHSLLSLFSCNGTKFVGDGELLLTHNGVTSTDPTVPVSSLAQYIKQSPNTKWFSSLKVPLGIYSLSGTDTTKRVNRLLRKWGEAPVVLDTVKQQQSIVSLRQAIRNAGYLDAEVTAHNTVKGKKVRVNYIVTPGPRYTLRHLTYNIADNVIDSLLRSSYLHEGGLREGTPFSVNALYEERSRITNWLSERGYLYFNKEAITFHVDSSRQERLADVNMNIGLYRRSSSEPLANHPRYYIHGVTYHSPSGELPLRARTLDINTLLRTGEVYKESNVQKTYSKFSRLGAIRSTNIRFSETPPSHMASQPSQLSPGADSLAFVRHGALARNAGMHPLYADIMLSQRKTHSIQVQPEGTNTAGDFGAALSVTYENRNVFGGSETFSLQARGAFEAIKGLEGYQNDNFVEYSFEGKLTFPEFVIPGISRDFQRRHSARTELLLSYNRQNRPEFHRRVFTGTWRYRWQASSGRIGYQYDFLDLNYVSMPWISDTFKHDYLDSSTNRNAILRYNYENLLIMKMGFGFTYNDGRHFLKLNVETAGNTLAGAARLFKFSKNEEGQYKFALVAFAQYVKFDADYTRLFTLDHRNSLALHARIGVAVPYGNSSILPFEKRYFSGGANSVRGWSVRELGPGRYRGTDGRIDFINQTGDMRIDLNAELRTNLFWKFQGALFIDAGNVWTLRDYTDQPGGVFTLRSLYDEMAVAYGLGLRLNFNYFLLRLDLGMKAVNPNYTTSREHFPITNPNFSRDYALHFAVGLPF